MAANDSSVSAVRRALVMEPGRVIAGKFRLTREIGQGGMGAVWSAVHQALGREVAVKFLHPQVDHSPSITERFVSEARMVASIKHRFVVDVFDFGVTEDGLYYMVLELLQGSSLAERMDRGPALPLSVAVQLIADCMRGLQVVHEAGIVHRDLKPDNIFVIEDADGVFPKLIDFGISKRTEVSGALPPLAKLGGRKSRLTQPGMVVGTPYYMSPEQLRGRSDLDGRSDVYSVGVILYELLTGQLPFEQDNIGDLMVAITVQGAVPLSSLRPELGANLSAVVARALAPDSSERYASALDLRAALLACLSTLPVDAETIVQGAGGARRVPQPSPPLPAARVSPLPPVGVLAKRERAKRAVGVGLAALMLVAMLIWLLHKPDSEPSAIPLRVEASPTVGLTQAVQAPATAAASPAAPKQRAAGSGDAHATGTDVVAPAAAPIPSAAAAAPPKHSVSRAGGTQHRAAPNAQNRATANPGSNHSDKPQKLYRQLDF
jgi:hypothetical protein